MPSTLLERRHLIPLSHAARGSKGREVQRIKPSVTLDLLAVEVELFAAADPAIAQAPLVKRRRSIAILQAGTPIANGRQCLLEEARAARPMRNPAPTAIRGPWVD
jgi:hypothetical protein